MSFAALSPLEEIQDAIVNEDVIGFMYFKRSGFGEYRRLSPYEFSGDYKTVIGWDHAKDELRRFSLDKIPGPVEFLDEEDYRQPQEKE